MLDNVIMFTHLAEIKNFRLTAEYLKTSSSTLSKRINELEKHLGKKLFIRDTRNLSITPAGEILYSHYKNEKNHFSQVISEINNKKSLNKNEEVSISIGANIAAHLISPFIPDFLQLNQNINLNVISTQNPPIVGDGAADIAISQFEVNNAEFESIRLRGEFIKLFCTKGFAQKFALPKTIEDLPKYIANRQFMGLIDSVSNSEATDITLENIYTGATYNLELDNLPIKTNCCDFSQIFGQNMDLIFGSWTFSATEKIKSGFILPILEEWVYRQNFYLIKRRRPSNPELLVINFLSDCMSREYKSYSNYTNQSIS